MKKLLIILSLFIFGALPALAQDGSNIIHLDDNTPAIDAVITLPPDTTGTISLNLANASVDLTDSAGNLVLHVADPRLHALEINIMPNTGSHTLTISRLPNMTEALVTVIAIPELTIFGTTAPVTTPNLTLSQEVMLTLDPSAPGTTNIVTIPAETQGLITANFVGMTVTTQWVDENGVIVLETVGGHVDGINAVLDGGQYSITALANGLTTPLPMTIRAIEAKEGGFVVMDAPENLVEATLDAPVTVDCTVTIALSSVNLRSGPGTGYSVMQYGYFNTTYPVGGQNPEANWLVIGTSDGESAWVSRDTVQLNGVCDALTVFNIPLRDAPVAQVIITNGSGTQLPPTYNNNDDDDHEERENDDHDDDDDDDHDDD